MNKITHNIVLAIGSNVGDRKAALCAAVSKLASFVAITNISPVYETAAAYITDQASFLNAALTGTTKLDPETLLRNLKQLESEIGRETTFLYGPRVLDIDIIFYDDKVLETANLTLPHPRLAEREFVLLPLADIVPDWKHPLSGLTVGEMLDRVETSNPLCLGPLVSDVA